MILRDRDDNSAWNSAGDGTLERRDYYCQNWHADIAALISDTGKMVEWGQYPGAYGLEFGLPGTDVDADGDVDAADGTQYTAWIGISAYRVRADWDLDNDVDAFDSAERSSRNGLTQGLGALSYVKSTRSVAGYVNDRVVPVKHIRHRVLHNELGRWVQRDPAGYVDGANLYACAKANSLNNSVSQGFASRCMMIGGSCHKTESDLNGNGQVDLLSYAHQGCPGKVDDALQDYDCKWLCGKTYPDLGTCGCYGGMQKCCNCVNSIHDTIYKKSPPPGGFWEKLYQCVDKCESCHKDNYKCRVKLIPIAPEYIEWEPLKWHKPNKYEIPKNPLDPDGKPLPPGWIDPCSECLVNGCIRDCIAEFTCEDEICQKIKDNNGIVTDYWCKACEKENANGPDIEDLATP